MDDYEKAGLTELRMNAKASIEMHKKHIEKLEELQKIIDIKSSVIADLVNTVAIIKQDLSLLKARLYENGIR